MRRYLVRALMAVGGAVSFAFYGGAAYLAYLLLRSLWYDRPSATVAAVLLVGLTLGLGYLSYRFGTDKLLDQLETRELTPESAPALFALVDDLCAQMEIDRPRLLVSNMGEPNAFAMSSPRGGVVVVDRSLVQFLSDDELETIVAHELAHLESHDSLVQLLAFTGLQTAMQAVLVALFPLFLLVTGVAKATAWFRGEPGAWTRSLAWRLRSLVLAVVMLVPVIVTFVLLARSRWREFAADRRAAEVTGKPLALASALRKVEDAARAELALRGMLPTEEGGEPSPLVRLLATHPATEQRIARLAAMANAAE